MSAMNAIDRKRAELAAKREQEFPDRLKLQHEKEAKEKAELEIKIEAQRVARETLAEQKRLANEEFSKKFHEMNPGGTLFNHIFQEIETNDTVRKGVVDYVSVRNGGEINLISVGHMRGGNYTSTAVTAHVDSLVEPFETIYGTHDERLLFAGDKNGFTPEHYAQSINKKSYDMPFEHQDMKGWALRARTCTSMWPTSWGEPWVTISVYKIPKGFFENLLSWFS